MDHNLRIMMDAHGKGRVFIDGVEINCVKSVSFTTEAGGKNAAVITVGSATVEIQSDATEIDDGA